MPKAGRRRTAFHGPSAPIRKRAFAVEENQVEHLEVGEGANIPATELLADGDGEDVPSQLTKKEKLQLKRAAFLERLETIHSPYSKSHQRRMKRKAKEQLASGLDEIRAVLKNIETAAETEDEAQEPDSTQRRKPPTGAIGEGKGSTLSKAQRKRALKLEQLRHPLILSNPHFVSNPFQTIRTHAQNTLLKHEVPE